MMFPFLRRYESFALLALRIAIGSIFLYHGLLKWGMEEPNAIMGILRFAEPIGGAAILFGALTQLAAAGLGIIMLGAIWMKWTGFGRSALDIFGTFAPSGGGVGWEFDLMILAGCIALFLLGGGFYSVDAAVQEGMQNKR